MNLPVCQIPGCGKTERAHQMLSHQFSSDGEHLAPKRHATSIRLGVAVDPVLRVLLVKKGIITVEELEATERELRAAGLLGGIDAGHGPHRGGDSEDRTGANARRGVRSDSSDRE